MAPTEELLKRDYPCGYGYYLQNGACRSYGDWYWWGRWVFAAVTVVFVCAVLVCLGCISARRRRRRGLQPRYGTGWLPAGKFNGPAPPNQAGYNNEMYPPQNGFQPGPPAYQQQQPQYTGTTFNPTDGYYGAPGAQQQGVQYPSGTYQRDQVYSPPPGPPPAKH